MSEDDLHDQIRQLQGKLEAANRKIRDLEHRGLHALVVRELKANRDVRVYEDDGKYTIEVGKNRWVESKSLYGVISAAWQEQWDSCS